MSAVIVSKPVHRLQIRPIVQGTPYHSPKLHPGRTVVWECGEEQTDRQTDRQTAVVNIHFASAMTHAKCNKRCMACWWPRVTFNLNPPIASLFNVITRAMCSYWPSPNICNCCVCDKGMIALILETIDKCSQWKSMRHLAHLIGEDSAAKWNDMINYLYLLLGTSASQSACKKRA